MCRSRCFFLRLVKKSITPFSLSSLLLVLLQWFLLLVVGGGWFRRGDLWWGSLRHLAYIRLSSSRIRESGRVDGGCRTASAPYGVLTTVVVYCGDWTLF